MKIKKMLPNSQIRAALSDSSVNDEARTVELIWTTGAKGMRSSWGERYYEELSLDPSHVDMSRLAEGAPLLASHDSYSLDSVIGVVERAWLEGNIGKAIVRFASDEASDKVFQKVKEKILRNVSVGYSVSEYTNVSEQGDEIPTYRATRWQPAEISIVPIGFDAGARTRSNEAVTESEVEIISVRSDEQETEVTQDSQVEQETEMTPEEKAKLEAEAAAKIALEATTQERKRVSEIRLAVRSASLEDTVADALIERGATADDARKEVIAKLAERSQAPVISNTVRVETGVDEMDKKRQGFEDGLRSRVDSTHTITEAGRAFSGMSLLRMIEGYMGRKMGETDANLAKRAMMNSDLPNILANVAEKSAQARYKLAPRTWSQWAKTSTLRNYKVATQLRAGDFGSLVERGENVDFATATFGEEKETAQLKDYGNIHAFSSQMIVNDDLKMIQQVISEGGVAAARLENKLVYSALKTNKVMGDGVVLYHSTHGNLGTPGAIGEVTFSEAYLKMRSQTSADGADPLNLAPKFLIVGPALETAARKFLALISPAATGDVNIFAGSVQLVVDAEITDDSYFFAASPSEIDTVTLFRLEGQESPTIESRIKWENNSLELKIAHAVGAAPMDYRGLVKNEVSSS